MIFAVRMILFFFCHHIILINTELEDSYSGANISESFEDDEAKDKSVRATEKCKSGTENCEIPENLVPPDNSCDSLCEDAPMYPGNTMREAYNKKKYIHERIIPTSPESFVVDFSSVSELLSNSGVGDICSTEIIELSPKIGKNRAGELRYILNIDERKTIVELNKCTATGEECNYLRLKAGDMLSHKLVCEQIVVYSNFEALHPIKREIVEELFPVQNGCCCLRKSMNESD